METLLRPAKQLAEWDSHFAQDLENYFRLLRQTQSVNFSEAALVLQNSANVYVRRVEYLWDETQALNQTLTAQSEEKISEEKTVKNKKGRKSKSAIDFNDFESLELNSLIGKSNLKEGNQKSVKLLTRRFTQLENSLAQLSSPIEILSTQGEVIGNKYDFRCNQQLTKNCMLVDELTPNDFLATTIAAASSDHETSIIPSQNQNQNASFDSMFEPNQSAASPASINREEMDTDANSCTIQNLGESSHIPDDADAGYTSGDAVEDSHESLSTRNPNTEEPSAIQAEVSPEETQPNVTNVEASASQTQSTPTTENTESQTLEPIPFENGVPDKIPRRRTAFKLPCHVALLKSKAQSRKRKNISESKKRENLTRILLDKYDHLVNKKLKAYSPTRQLFTPLKKEELEEFQRTFDQYLKSIRGSETYHYDAITRGVTMELLGFQPNFTKHDPLRDNNAYSNESTITDSDTILEPESDLASIPESFTTPPPTPEAANDRLNYRELVEQRMKQIGDESREQSELEQRVAEWHRSLRPKLTAAVRNPPFHIHEYGSRIIKTLEDSESQKIPFDNLVRTESPAEVARYFLASLQLANTYNVEINTNCDSGTGIELKLLEKEKSHDSTLNLHEKIDRLPLAEVSNDRTMLRISTT